MPCNHQLDIFRWSIKGHARSARLCDQSRSIPRAKLESTHVRILISRVPKQLIHPGIRILAACLHMFAKSQWSRERGERRRRERKEGRGSDGACSRRDETRQKGRSIGVLLLGSVYICLLSVKTEREGFYSKMPVTGSTYKYATTQAEIRGTER